MDDLQSKIKGFWQRPEGKFGIITVAAILALGAIGFVSLLPFLVTTVTQILFLAAVGGALFLCTRPSVQVFFKIACRFLTNFIVKIEPLAVLKEKVRDMESNLEKMVQSLTVLKQTLQRLARRIQENVSDIQENMALASRANKQGDSSQRTLAANKAGRRERSNLTLKALYDKIERMHQVLTKIHKNSELVVEDTKDEIQVTEEEYVAVKAANSAMKSAMAAMNGNADRRYLYEMAYEAIANDIANKSGELEQMLEMSDSLMKNIDLNQGMLEDRGMAMLDEWEKKADTWLQNSTTRNDAISKVSGKPTKALELSSTIEGVVAQTDQNQFSNLFNK